MMDHAEAHERIADLALEPGGLAAALAADAFDNGALAGHVATCERCQTDIEAWRGVQGALGRSLRSSGPGSRADIDPIEAGDALRARILGAAGATPARGVATAGSGLGGLGAEPGQAGAPRTRAFVATVPRVSSTILGLAAALIVAVAGTLLLAGPGTDLARTVDEARNLNGAIAAVDRILAAPDHEVLALRKTGGEVAGSIAWSSQDLVVLTSALQPPAPGSVYRCWLVGRSTETAIGKMDFAGGTAYWVGSLDEWASTALRPGWSFYVTLESGPAGSQRAGPVILEADITS
jgi:hypothetical protein